MQPSRPLAGIRVVITRPAGTGAALARRVRMRGGTPLLLPGSSLHAPDDLPAARAALRAALACDTVIFTSPSAVRFARRLAPLRGRAEVFAPGTGTQHALRRAGVQSVSTPIREDSEGILALPALQDMRGHRVGVVGAAGGRGLLDHELAARGAEVLHAHVYQRLPARLDRRHAEALRQAARKPLYILLTSTGALANILAGLSDAARRVLLAGSVVVCSTRLASTARQAGFACVLRATSAHADALLAAITENRGPMR